MGGGRGGGVKFVLEPYKQFYIPNLDSLHGIEENRLHFVLELLYDKSPSLQEIHEYDRLWGGPLSNSKRKNI